MNPVEEAGSAPDPVSAFHIMSKPVGPMCNLQCTYCFYLEKEQLFSSEEQFRMSDEVLEAYIRTYLESQDTPEVLFAWQGGEPTLLGVDFFRRAVELQQQLAGSRKVSNALQTNATLIDDEWATFFAEHNFLIGVSIDGPRELHDAYRVDKRGRPSFDEVMRGIALLKQHRAEFNTLTVVNRRNARHPLDVYRFLKEIGSEFLQFIPLVERRADEAAQRLGLDLALPPEGETETAPVTKWSVDPNDYGSFLTSIYDEWIRRDVGKVFVQLFDAALGRWVGRPGGLCVFQETCGDALALEHNGDLYACDHYVYPRYKLGNLLHQSLPEMVNAPRQRAFGAAKRDRLPAYCRSCEVRFACNGECPKHRFVTTPDGEPGLNYLCPAYRRFFTHIDEGMQRMKHLVRERRAPALVMDHFARQDRKTAWNTAAPGDPCPCGSSKLFKDCCGGL